MNDKQKSNLTKLLNFIPTIKEENFTARNYRTGNKSTLQVIGKSCLVGKSPILDTLENVNKYREDNGNIKFRDWSMEFFTNDVNQWNYLFSDSWYHTHNTLADAKLRVKTFIDNDYAVPDGWDDDYERLV